MWKVEKGTSKKSKTISAVLRGEIGETRIMTEEME